MKKLVLAATASAAALTLSAQASFADYTLNILHINDWHSRIESINRFDSTCSAEDETEGKCFGGAARLVTAARERRAALEGEGVVFLNAGDNFQGTLFYTTYKGEVEAEFLNLMGTDAMVVGNHEFDDGEDGLAGFLAKVEFPVVGSNIKASAASSLGDMVKPYTILEVNGRRIGIVGAVANDTADLSSPGENVSIEEDVASITEQVKALAREGVGTVIALTHVGYPRDLAAIAKIPGVDVVVGGHSNTLLSNTAEGAVGPYPTWVDNPLGYKVPVVQAYAYSKYLGELKVTFSDIGIVKEASGEPILLDASVTPGEAVLARIGELGAPIEELKNQVVAESAEAIDGSRDNCRAMECQMGNLVTDAMLDRTKDQGVQFAITNGGGLRASIDAGPVTMGEVLTVLPFQNTLATFQLKGADVVASLESGLSQIEDGAGRFPQVAGLRYTFDKSVAPGEGRVTSVEVDDGGNWVPIDPDATYTIATNNFMRGGGDGYGLFASNAENAYDYGPGLEQVVADYLAANSPYTPYLDGRISEGMMDKTMDETMDESMEKTEMAAAEGDKPMMADNNMHEVMAGDSLWDIAKAVYGDATKWTMIAEANPDINPKNLKIGAQLTIPAAN
ncbi:MAG: 5'-nucleotidase C-terminal domain-containing protein [Rhizobiaceae bacterium]|nr:5'-nucleotidase C-terminal domain-containing protein [Rhizobiaceae bacterium]